MRLRDQSLASLGGLRIRCCRELWYRSHMQLSSRVAVAVWLWYKMATEALICPLAWKHPYAASEDLKGKKRKKKKKTIPTDFEVLRSSSSLVTLPRGPSACLSLGFLNGGDHVFTPVVVRRVKHGNNRVEMCVHKMTARIIIILTLRRLIKSLSSPCIENNSRCSKRHPKQKLPGDCQPLNDRDDTELISSRFD